MVIYSIIAYAVLAVCYVFGNEKLQRISALLSVGISSFLAYWYWDVNNVAMAIYFVVGIVNIFFYYIALDSIVINPKKKYRVIAVILGILLGIVGAHRFYLGKKGSAAFYILFSWTFIPAIIALLEVVRYIVIGNVEFDSCYNANVKHKAPKTKKVKYKPEPTTKVSIDESNINNSELHPKKFVKPQNEGCSDTKESSETVDYPKIRLPMGEGKATGTLENFKITVYKNGKGYEFYALNGDISSFKAPNMHSPKQYEV